mgnify:CR=1 FL=1
MINDYGKFVNTTTSNESKFTGDFIQRLMVFDKIESLYINCEYSCSFDLPKLFIVI